MKGISNFWSNAKRSKVGWTGVVTLFALGFGLLALLITGILSLPMLLDDGFKYGDEILTIIFPLVVLGLSFLCAKYLAKKKKANLRDLLRWNKPSKNAIWMTPLILFVYVFVLVISMAVLQMLSPNLAGQQQEVAKDVSSSGGLRLVLMVFSVGILTPFAEETFFRGLLLSLYSKRLKVTLSIVVVAALFGLAHGQVNVGIDTFLFGLALGTLTWKTESIYPAISLHMLKNLLAVWAIIATR